MLITGIGRLGRDAEVRYIPDGTAVANLALAFNYGRKQQDGSRLSQWVECSLWGKQAESLAQYLKKGNQVSITADGPHIETFTKGDGSQGNKLVANIINLELIGGQNQGNSESQGNTQGAQNQQSSRQSAGQDNKPRDNFDDYDDQIPF